MSYTQLIKDTLDILDLNVSIGYTKKDQGRDPLASNNSKILLHQHHLTKR
ncbi:hypothetical protein ACUXCF_002559 [Enterococcus casseliflavus]